MTTNELIAVIAAAAAIPTSFASWRLVKPNSQSLVAEVHSRVLADLRVDRDEAKRERDDALKRVDDLERQVEKLIDRTDLSRVFAMLDEQMRQAIEGRVAHDSKAEERTKRLEDGINRVVDAVHELKPPQQ